MVWVVVAAVVGEALRIVVRWRDTVRIRRALRAAVRAEMKEIGETAGQIAADIPRVRFNASLPTRAWEDLNAARADSLVTDERARLGQLYRDVDRVNSLQQIVPAIAIIQFTGSDEVAESFAGMAERFASSDLYRTVATAASAEVAGAFPERRPSRLRSLQRRV